MSGDIATEANRLKQLSGKDLQEFLIELFTKLKKEKVIKQFEQNRNFNHKGFTYKKQYLANFIIETLDGKFIIINSSNSYRHDRMKTQAYDVEGVTNNAIISDQIIASILLYPDQELENKSLIKFRNNVISKKAYSPATHIIVISELVEFLENHKNHVTLASESRDGSYYGLRGNAFEKEVVSDLNSRENLKHLITNSHIESPIFEEVLTKICSDYSVRNQDVINIHASDTVLKLTSGGNAKTDIIIDITTIDNCIRETISVKNTTQNRVSCHDYKCDDFIRVLGIQDTKLAKYLELYQKSGSKGAFLSNMSEDMDHDDFVKLLAPYKQELLEWALTGKHDCKNLIDPKSQISNYLLINKSGNIRFVDFSSYMDELYAKSITLTYGLPLSWTYPSKQRGARIQLKLPILL
ncbi:MspI family type II restriction endonuclease [Photobacterium swingsii]|uniref:MspI family type II restriction endonuclease n=1 Tax=Photobacterium swingsii TaxID=680026 RepID=UPI004068C06C